MDQDLLDRLNAISAQARTPIVMPSAGVSPFPYAHPPANTLGLNEKLMFDDTFSDISHNRKSMIRHQEAWESLRLTQAQLMGIAAHAINMNVVIAAQSGDTQGQFGQQPQQQGAASNVAAGAVPANRATDNASSAIAAGIAESVQTNVTTQVSALTQQMGVLTTTVVGLAQAVQEGNAAIAAALAQLIQNSKQGNTPAAGATS